MVEIGKTAGFCAGVRICVKQLKKEVKDAKEVYCLGEVVHNKDVVSEFKKSGVKFVDSLDEVPDNSVVAFRAHGVEKKVYEDAKKRGMRIVDLTCPFVYNIRKIVEPFLDNSYIILIAQKTHPEALSTISFCGDNCSIVEDKSDIDEIIDTINKFSQVVIVSQTTFNEEKFNKYCDIIREKYNGNISINNTICAATHMRQEETKKMAKEFDTMIIIGGSNSSNTQKLYEISSKYCENTLLCENVKGLNLKKVTGNVGIMAGASTPSNIIYEVYEAVNK